jgi:hypothetical protein
MSKTSLSLVIATGASLSNQASFRGVSPKAVFLPAGAAGSWLAFKRGEGSNIGYCRGWSGEKLTAAFTAGAWLELDPTDLAGVDTLAVETCGDESGTAQVQSGAVTITVIGF